jgi:hypothetical protein
MNLRRFKNSFLTFFFAGALLMAWLIDHSASAYQLRMDWLIACLLTLLALAMATLIGAEKRAIPRVSSMSKQQQRNAAMFRHQPNHAAFNVRVVANEQQRKRYKINPNHPAFK